MTSRVTAAVLMPAGDPNGIRIATLGRQIVRVAVVPLAMIDEARHWVPSRGPTPYVLVGKDAASRARAMVRTSSTAFVDLQDWSTSGSIWTHALVLTNSTGNLLPVPATALAQRLVEQIHAARRYLLIEDAEDDAAAPTSTEAGEEIERYLPTIRTLTTCLGFPVLDPVESFSEPPFRPMSKLPTVLYRSEVNVRVLAGEDADPAEETLPEETHTDREDAEPEHAPEASVASSTPAAAPTKDPEPETVRGSEAADPFPGGWPVGATVQGRDDETPSQQVYFRCLISPDGVKATGTLNKDQSITIASGAMGRTAMSQSGRELQNALLKNGVLRRVGSRAITFRRDWTFRSREAASEVLGSARGTWLDAATGASVDARESSPPIPPPPPPRPARSVPESVGEAADAAAATAAIRAQRTRMFPEDGTLQCRLPVAELDDPITGQLHRDGTLTVPAGTTGRRAYSVAARLRQEELLATGKVLLDKGSVLFLEDVTFTNPSRAAMAAADMIGHGWSLWADDAGDPISFYRDSM